jgi:hypothetical protein
MQKNIPKYKRRKIYTETLAHPKILAHAENLADGKNLAHAKNLADGKNFAHAKNLADGKNLAHAKNLADGKNSAHVKNLAPPKSLVPVRNSAPGKILASIEMLAQQEKWAEPLVNALLFRLSRICNCGLLSGPADEHNLLLVDVEPRTCSLQVRNELSRPCFYGRTLSRTIPAACTGPPHSEMVKSLAQAKSLVSA